MVVINLVSYFTLTWILIYFSYPFFKRFLKDKPNYRSSHKKITPNGVGIIFIITSSIGFAISSNYLFIANSLLGILGFVDDKLKLSSALRFLFQFIFVNSLIFYSDIFLAFFENNNLITNFIFWIISNLILIGIINFINFMDGIDGLVGGSMVPIVLASSIISSTNFYFLVGALLGFLMWNWEPSKVFMGDAGSTFLGGFIVTNLTKANSVEDGVLLFLIAFPLLCDAFICLLRRLIDRQKIFEAHKLHLYQRLHQAGWSHGRVSSIYLVSTSLLAMSCIIGNWTMILFILLVILSSGIYLDRFFAKPFAN